MCISIPAKILERTPDAALVEVDGGIRRRVLVAPDVELGTPWVLLHGGIAVAALTAEEAEEMRSLLRVAKGAAH